MGGGYLCFFGANLHYFSIWVMENLDPEIYWIYIGSLMVNPLIDPHLDP